MMFDNGGPAFPQSTAESVDGQPVMGFFAGMTLRDYFAAKAMNGMLKDSYHVTSFIHKADEFGVTPEEYLASVAYSLADAMLKERAK